MPLADAITTRLRNGVLEGADGMLFAFGEQHFTDALLGRLGIPNQPLANFRRNLLERAAKTAVRRTQWCHLLVPDKSSVYPEKMLLGDVRTVGAAYAASVENADSLVYPLEALRARRLTEAVYPSGDSHPSHSANVFLLMSCLERLQLPAAVASCDHLRGGGIFRERPGDLGSLVGRGNELMEEAAECAGLISLDDGLPAMIDGSLRIHVNEQAPQSGRLLVFGDSCLALIAALAARVFREVVFCRTLLFHDEIVDGVAPDFIVTGHSDRYYWLQADVERHLFLNLPALQEIVLPKRRRFWELADAILMSSFERHRFYDALSRIRASGEE